MDIASKIKFLKEEATRKDDEKIELEKQINELKGLVEGNKRRDIKIEELKKTQEDLLAQL